MIYIIPENGRLFFYKSRPFLSKNSMQNKINSSITNRLITAKDHASVQIIVGEVDEKGLYTGKSVQYNLSGFVRRSGEADDSLNHKATKDGCK